MKELQFNSIVVEALLHEIYRSIDYLKSIDAYGNGLQ